MYTIMMRSLLLFVWLISYSLQAQVSDPAKWTFTLSSANIHVGDTIEIMAKATIEANWYLYSNDFDPTLGPTLTEFTFEPNDSYGLVGKTIPVKPKKKYDAVWSGDVTYFVEHGEFRQKVIVLKENLVVAVSVEYQTCNDLLGRCIPGDEEYVFKNLSIKPAIKGSTKETVQVKKPVHSGIKSTVPELEAEKEKLVQTDAAGNDIAVDYLKSFVKKYGK